MIEGAAWRRWVFFRIPLALFVFVLLFPFYWMVITSFRPDGELYRPWNAENYNPFWTWNWTLTHVEYLFGETMFATWLWNSPTAGYREGCSRGWRMRALKSTWAASSWNRLPKRPASCAAAWETATAWAPRFRRQPPRR